MERAEKIKDGILGLITKGSFDQALELVCQFEKAVPNDPDVFNLKAIIYNSQGEFDKAFKTLDSGIKKHPHDFDIHYNLACIYERQGKLLSAFDTYTKAYDLTNEKLNKKEIMALLDKLQEEIKNNVEKSLKNNPKAESNLPSALEAKRQTKIVEVDIAKCRNQYAFGYGNTSWNPFVETLKETMENPKLSYEGSVLNKYYFLFRPKNFQQALMGTLEKDMAPIDSGWHPFPWGDFKYEEKIEAIRNKDYPDFGPYPASKGKLEMQSLINHYKLIQETGYHPQAFEDDYIKGYILKTKNDYRFVVCEGQHRLAVLVALGYEKICCEILDVKNSPSIVDIRAINKWPQVKRQIYTVEVAKKVFYSFFNYNGRERAIEANLLCDNLDHEKAEKLNQVGVDLKDHINVNFYNAGLLNNIDEDFAHQVKKYWQKHYSRDIDPGHHLAFMNLTGKKEPRIVPHRIMRGEIIPLSNHIDMGRIGYSDKNIYDKLIPTSNAPKTVLKRVRGKYFDVENNCLDQQEAFKVILNTQRDLIIKPSTTDDGVGVAKLVIKGDNLYLKGKIVIMSDIESKWGSDFIIQEKVEQHPVMAKPHPASVNALRMVTYRWKKEVRNVSACAFFGTDNRVQNNVGLLSCGISDSGEFFDYAIDKKAKVYTHHPTSNYCFSEYAKIPNYEKIKKFVRDLHKEVLHQDYICWDIIVGVDGEPIFLELNFWGTTWLYQMSSESCFFTDFTEEILEYMKKHRDNKI